MTTRMSSYKHTVVAVYNPGDVTGFIYTKGLSPFELFALDVPYELVDEVANLMNFLSRRIVLPNQTAQSDDLMVRISPVRTKQRKHLMRTKLLQMQPDAVILQLVPLEGWATAHMSAPECFCEECKCVDCEV